MEKWLRGLKRLKRVTFSYSVEVFHTLSRLFVPTASQKGSHLFAYLGARCPLKGSHRGLSPILEPEKRGLSTLKTSQKRGLTIKFGQKGSHQIKIFGVLRAPGPPKRGLLNLEKGGTTRSYSGLFFRISLRPKGGVIPPAL
jgi:hypothetical protein